MLNLKYKKTAGVVIAILILSIVFISYNYVKDSKLPSISKVNELRALYKTYNSEPQLLSTTGKVFTLDYVAKTVDLIIIGEIIEELDKYKGNPAGNGTPEKAISDKLEQNGVRDTRSTFSQARVKVLDTIKGEKLNEVIIIRNSIYDNYEPPYTPGQKVVLFLGNGGSAHKGKFWCTKYGYYYITKDELVVSAMSSDEFNKYTGMKLDKLKSVM